MKKFNRTPMRLEKEPGVETEIWQPDWDCFCCHDSGIIAPHLAAMIIEGYDFDKDKLPRCVAPGCQSGSQYDSDALRHSVDYQVDALTCQQLSSMERNDWIRVAKTKQKRIIEVRHLADKLAMPGSRDRTDNDNREVQVRKQNIEAISHEQWLKMANSQGADDDW